MKSASKIFILSNRLTHGGAERVASNLADGLVELGYQVNLYVCQDDVETYRPTSDVRVCYYPDVKSYRWGIWRHWQMISFIRAEIRKHQPEVIIGILWYFAFVAKVAQWLSGRSIPVIYSEHNSLERPVIEPMSRKEAFFKFYFSRFCDAYTLLTEADRKRGEEKGLKNIVVMPNPLGLEPATGVVSKEPIILAAGRLDVWVCKGWDILLNAWGRVAATFPQWKLHIVGAGSVADKKRLEHLAEQNGVKERFKIIDYTEDIVKLYQSASVFVLSSRYEGFGLVLIEAMSQGCACIAADYKGRQGEIISHGTDGLLCEVENPADLAEKMGMLLSDEKLRATLQRNALQSVSRFSLENYAMRWDKLMESLLN